MSCTIFGVTVTLTFTSGLSSRIIVSPILFDVGCADFVFGWILVLLIVAYYFGVTVTLTSDLCSIKIVYGAYLLCYMTYKS